MLNYSLTANEDKMISYAVFNVSNAEAPWYLPFCASMTYANAKQEKAFEWVKENCNQESSCQIGDAIYEIYPNKKGGAMLTITAEGYTEWCMQEMLKMYPAF